jgi:hypothetical protein
MPCVYKNSVDLGSGMCPLRVIYRSGYLSFNNSLKVTLKWDAALSWTTFCSVVNPVVVVERCFVESHDNLPLPEYAKKTWRCINVATGKYHITGNYLPMLNTEVHDAMPSGSCLSWKNTKDRKKMVIGTMSPESSKKKLRSSRVTLWTQTIHSPQVVSIHDLLMKNPPFCRTMCSAAGFPSQSA